MEDFSGFDLLSSDLTSCSIGMAVLLATLIALLIGWYIKSRFEASSAGKRLPPGSFGFPLVGETVGFLKATRNGKGDQWLQNHFHKYGPVFKSSLFGFKVVFLKGQAANRFLFSGRDSSIASNLLEVSARIFGKNSIFELSVSRHKLVRGAMMNFLKAESIRGYLTEMDSLVQQRIFQELDGQDSIKIVPFLKRITFHVTCSLFFGLPEGKEKDQLFEDFIVAFRGTVSLPLNLPGTTYRKAVLARGRIEKILSRLIRNTKKRTGKEGDYQQSQSQVDVISSFLELRDENNQPLPDTDIVDHLVTLIIASHDTVTVLVSQMIRHLARDYEVLNKVLEEQKKVVIVRRENDGKISWSEMQTMKYTWRVAQEVLRLSPPVTGNMKTVTRDTKFDGFDIPQGWKVTWLAWGTHRDEAIFEEPDKFDPSRFDTSSMSKTFPPYTYIPFGAGPRICPGAEFARIEALLIIHHMVSNYRWSELIPDEPITHFPLPYPAMGLPVKLHPTKIIV